MKIIVTGGAGFIGGNFCHYMVGKYPDDTIICLDKLTYAGNMETLEPIMDKPNFRFVKEDIANREGVYALFEKEKPDAVINFAAESHVDRSITDPEIFLRTNIIGTSVLLDACREYGIQRFHQVSTDEVYGDLPLDRPDLFFTETTPIHTSSPYSASKASADLLVQAYGRTYGLPITISRCSNNYGPYHFPEKLIPLMIANALNDKALPVYGKGENVRDEGKIEDAIWTLENISLESLSTEGARGMYRTVMEAGKGSIFDSIYNEGKTAYDTADFARAVKYLKVAVAIDSEAVDAWYYLGKSYEASSDIEHAQQVKDYINEHFPNSQYAGNRSSQGGNDTQAGGDEEGNGDDGQNEGDDGQDADGGQGAGDDSQDADGGQGAGDDNQDANGD